MPKFIPQRTVDRIRWYYDNTTLSIDKIARRFEVAPGTVVKYIDRRDVRPTQEQDAPAVEGGGPSSRKDEVCDRDSSTGGLP